MKPILKAIALFGAAAMLTLSSCSGSSASDSFQPDKIREVSENIKNNGGSESDYNFLIDQLLYITKNAEAKQAEADAETDPEKAKQLKKENMEMGLTAAGIGLLLQSAESKGELPEGSIKKLEKAKEEFDK